MFVEGLECDLEGSARAPLHKIAPRTWKATLSLPAGVYSSGFVYTPTGKAFPYTVFTPIILPSWGVIMVTFFDGDAALSAELRKVLALAA